MRLLPTLLLLLALPVRALTLEALPLTEGPDEQAYNYQEQGELRVWARSQAGFKASRIWLQRRVDGQWRAPEPWAHSAPRFRDSDPFLSSDGRQLLFISDRPEAGSEPLQQLDLFESRLQDDGRWSPPRRLPEALQSPGYELGPERHGGTLWFGSYRAQAQAGGPGKLALFRAPADGSGVPQALPAPLNDGGANSDPTLSPDGRYLLWWSARSGGGDLYLAERLGDERWGPPLRLPEPVNSSEGFEFTPWIGADGEWLHFASTRPVAGQPAGLARVYRVRWPALLQELGAAAQSASQAELDEANTALWQALSHGAQEAADAAALRRLLHPQAQVWGALARERSTVAVRLSGAEFAQAMQRPDPRPMKECELAREVRRYGATAQVYSRVRSDREAGSTPYTGVNSLQWQLGPQGWQLLSLQFALDLPGEPLPATGECLRRAAAGPPESTHAPALLGPPGPALSAPARHR